MKFPRTGIALFVIVLIGITFFSFSMKRKEDRQNRQDLLTKGSYLISLISLYPITDFEIDKRNFFLRTLTEYTSKQGFFYLFIHDNTRKHLISLAPDGLSSKIPKDVVRKSLNAAGLTHQTFENTGSGQMVFEFARPVYENGQRTGTVRLGLKLAPVSLFSLERISLLAMIAFFIFAALSMGYYGITLSLKPLKNLNKTFLRISGGSAPAGVDSIKIGRISPIIEDVEKSLHQIRDKLKLIETDNIELVSKLGVTTFEKNKITKILDSLDFGVILTDTQENIDHINEFMLKLLNRKREEVIDREFGEIIEHEKISSFVMQLEMLGQSVTVDGVDTVFSNVSPGEIFKISATYLMGGENEPIGKIISFHNVTNEALADKAKHEFIAHVSHEILTPITNIKSYSEMLMDDEIDDLEMQKEFYNTIDEQTNRLSSLIKNLLNISKMEMGSLTINKNLVRTDWFFDDCLSSIEGSANDKGITIVRHLPDAFPSLVADKDLLKAAIINILGNALKYTPENGAITFSISEMDQMVIFDIVDTGHGISQEDLPHIFEKFYRSDNPNITDQAGSGLGLALTAEIVHLHKGEIDVQSEFGKGTHFTIKLPKEEYFIGET